jgi:hypothetical protein
MHQRSVQPGPEATRADEAARVREGARMAPERIPRRPEQAPGMGSTVRSCVELQYVRVKGAIERLFPWIHPERGGISYNTDGH